MAGEWADPRMDDDQVCQATNRIVKAAWENGNMKLWKWYFSEGTPTYVKCPFNKEFLFAVVDFVDLWEGCCEKVNYAR